MPLPASELVGGRYAVREVLAVGGMSTVHLAEDVRLGREVALKVFRTCGDPLAVDRLRQEGVLLARLDHPHLVRGFDAGADEDGSGAWLALELVPGPNVAVALHRGGPLSPAGVRRLVEHVAGALAHIHELGIVHRDVKPSNLLLTADPHADASWIAKLADFGIATEVQAGLVLAGGAPMGTAAYFSPEQTLGQPVSTASDIYSLGLVAIEALTGERAFPGGAVESATARLFRQPALPGWLDEGWRALLELMTARDARSRPSAAQVRAACRSLTTELLAAPAISAALADYDPDVRTEPATMLAPALPVAAAAEAPAVARGPWLWRRRPQRPAAHLSDRLGRRALVVSSAGVLVLGTAAGGAVLVAAAPTTPIPLEQALPVAPPVTVPQVTPTPVPEAAATPRATTIGVSLPAMVHSALPAVASTPARATVAVAKHVTGGRTSTNPHGSGKHAAAKAAGSHRAGHGRAAHRAAGAHGTAH